MRLKITIPLLGMIVAASQSVAIAAPMTLTGERPLVISHRGASGYLPEESIQAYQLALKMRPDFIEGDVYMTADGVPVMLHDGTLNATTNVVAYAASHPEIAALRSSNGSYDVHKFTVAQLKALDLNCRAATGYCADKSYFDTNTSYKFTTYSEFLDLAYQNYKTTGNAVGVYPEAKDSGLVVADAILAGLNDPKYNGYFLQPGHAFTQSFDSTQVAYLNSHSPIPVTYLGVLPGSASAATTIAAFADGVGPSTSQLTPEKVALAHQAGLFVHPYTYLTDAARFAHDYELGVDGVFTNFPDIAETVRDQVFPSTVPLPGAAPLFGAALLTLGGWSVLAKRKRASLAG